MVICIKKEREGILKQKMSQMTQIALSRMCYHEQLMTSNFPIKEDELGLMIRRNELFIMK